MLLGMLRQALRRLFPLSESAVNWPTPLAEDDVPSTIRVDGPSTYVPDTEPIDGWRELADRQAFRDAWMRRNARRFGAATRDDLRDEA